MHVPGCRASSARRLSHPSGRRGRHAALTPLDRPVGAIAPNRPFVPSRLTEVALVKGELVLLEGLQGHLLVEQPHSHVEPLVSHLAAALKLDPASKHRMAVAALSAANDSLRTDAALLLPPLAIAAACALIAAALQADVEFDGSRWAEEVLGGPAEGAAALAACPVLLTEYREFSGREVRARACTPSLETRVARCSSVFARPAFIS